MSRNLKAEELVLRVPELWSGDARLYRCAPGGSLPEYVVVSAVKEDTFGPAETLVFATNEFGKSDAIVVDDLRDRLPGSFVGGMDHKQALLNAGYEVDDG